MAAVSAGRIKPYKGINMEGLIAAWYAKNTAGAAPEMRTLAERIAREVPCGAPVLEVAPGPGYLALELARLGLAVSALDISRSFVRLTTRNAKQAGVMIDARQGDAAALPFAPESFDFVVCRAAFKNFGDPVGALKEMRRVLRPGGTALIIDMKKEATNRDIADEVRTMRLGPLDALITRGALRSLRGRAYTAPDLVRMIGQSGFADHRVDPGPIGFEIRLTR